MARRGKISGQSDKNAKLPQAAKNHRDAAAGARTAGGLLEGLPASTRRQL